MYRSELWVMANVEENWLHRWKQKILRKVYGAVMDGQVQRIRTIEKLEQLFGEPDVVTKIKRGRIKWATLSAEVTRKLTNEHYFQWLIGWRKEENMQPQK